MGANEVVYNQLQNLGHAVEENTESDLLSIASPIYSGVDDQVRQLLDSASQRRRSLSVLLETNGGSIEVTQRIAEVLRHHYPKNVEFIVSNYAYSAGTVLVMSGDAIWMDYYSVLGPIDPQVQSSSGKYVPALGYLDHYDQLIEKSNAGKLSQAELLFLIDKFDPAELYRYKQARNLSISLLKEWLAKYKFKNWKKTESRGETVTPQMRSERAEQIATNLSDAGAWHSHGRGISMSVLRQKLKLKIDDFGADEARSKSIPPYYSLLKDFMTRLGCSACLHYQGTFAPIAHSP